MIQVCDIFFLKVNNKDTPEKSIPVKVLKGGECFRASKQLINISYFFPEISP